MGSDCDCPAEGHGSACSNVNVFRREAPHQIDYDLRHGNEPDWPFVQGDFAAGMVPNGIHVSVPNYGWNTAYGFRLQGRADVSDLIALLERVRERLP